MRSDPRGHVVTRRRGRATTPGPHRGSWLLVLLVAGFFAPVGCDFGDDFAEDLVEKTARRNEERRLEQQREELPLPDPAVVPYKSVSSADLELDESFRVDLVDDLVIGEGRTDPDYLFVSFPGGSSGLGNIAVDGDGRFYILETRSDEVRVFGDDGRFLFKFGQPGEGPGDFQRPHGIVIAGEQVHVFHRSFFSSVWSLDGELLEDRQTVLTPETATAEGEVDDRRFRRPLSISGRPDGSMLMTFRAVPEGGQMGRITTPYVRVMGRFEGGRETGRIIEVPEWAGPSFAVSPEGELYVGMFGHLRNEHYIVALAADGTPRWTLASPWDPEIPPRADLRVDGEGRLYVFPNFRTDVEDPRRPVRVFTRGGELIGSGYLNRRPIWVNWQITKPDFVYGVRVSPVTSEWEVVRYRLEISSE